MCGIFGIVVHRNKVKENNINKVNSILKTRGPDDHSIFEDDNVLFLHRRLSVRDVSEKGKQPMVSSCRRFVICYNGEYYNTHKKKKALMGEGIKFKSESDTEVLLESIAKYGFEKTLKEINGMFAFSLFDRKKRCIYIARDRIGIKPLFYNYNKNKLIFSSDIRAISKSTYFKEELSLEGIYKFIKNGYIKGPTSIYSNVYKLKPGTFAKLDLKTFTLEHKEYWSLKKVFYNPISSKSYNECKEILHEKLKESVQLRTISDVPIGAFLSGGIDSSLITSIMQSMSDKPVNTFSIGFHDKRFNEAKFAKKISTHLGTNHTELYLDDIDSLSVVNKLSTIYSEPFADASQIPTILVSELTRKNVTVALGGDGGDETFLGYNRYLYVSSLFKKMNKLPFKIRLFLSTIINKFSSQFFNQMNVIAENISFRKLSIPNAENKFYKLGELLKCENIETFYDKVTSQIFTPNDYLLHEFKDKVTPSFELSKRADAELLAFQDTLEYLVDDILVKIDKASMSTSLEVRVPFLDHNIVEFSASIPYEFKIKNGQGKYILQDILGEYMPRSLFERSKMGFSVPLDNWMRDGLKELLLDTLTSSKIRENQILHDSNIQKLISDHFARIKNNGYQLWNLLMFQMWLDKEGSY